MIKNLICVIAITLIATTAAWGDLIGGYQYISAPQLQDRLKSKSPIILVDICVVEQFAKGHIPGSIETNAYPVETDEQRQSLAKVLPKILASADDVVIVCPRGGGGAKKTFDFYKSQGVDEKRLLILEKGMDNWPYATEVK
ncbi:MAG: rhodanese-like domain-containing protein [Proteobacteria bacterium]|nr:rhodanese-like domain-containing protein [Pseudomonadota bacterium]